MIKDGEAPPPLDQLICDRLSSALLSQIRSFYLFIDGNLDNLETGMAGYLGNMLMGGASAI